MTKVSRFSKRKAESLRRHAVQKAVQKERDRCAVIADGWTRPLNGGNYPDVVPKKIRDGAI